MFLVQCLLAWLSASSRCSLALRGLCCLIRHSKQMCGGCPSGYAIRLRDGNSTIKPSLTSLNAMDNSKKRYWNKSAKPPPKKNANVSPATCMIRLNSKCGAFMPASLPPKRVGITTQQARKSRSMMYAKQCKPPKPKCEPCFSTCAQRH